MPMRFIFGLTLILGCLLLQTTAFGGSRTKKSDGPGVEVPSLGNDHISSIGAPHQPYNSDPPTSGPHVAFIAKWGIYKIPVPKELQVHNLEDGGVLIQYDCQSCNGLIAKLEALVRRYLEKATQEKLKAADPSRPTRYEHLLLAPYPGMDATIALTAWGRIDKFKSYDEARIVRFIEAYIGVDHHPAHE